MAAELLVCQQAVIDWVKNLHALATASLLGVVEISLVCCDRAGPAAHMIVSGL